MISDWQRQDDLAQSARFRRREVAWEVNHNREIASKQIVDGVDIAHFDRLCCGPRDGVGCLGA